MIRTLARSALLLGLLFQLSSSRADEPPADVIARPAAGEFLIIPLRLHVLQSKDLPEIDCKLSDSDLQRIVGKMNRIWNKAGIHWGLESIVHEAANASEKFRLARELEDTVPLEAYRWLIPEKTREFDGLHIYYIHDFSVNGVWLGEDYAIVKETAKLREVEGGIDEPIPRVSSHELGHILGLPHRQDRTNLLASGTTGTRLNTNEVKIARAQALRIGGVRGYPDLTEVSKDETDPAKSAMYKRWLSEIDKPDASK